MWRLETKNLPAGVSHLIVDDHGVIALVKRRGKAVKAGPLLAAAPEMLASLRKAQAALAMMTEPNAIWASTPEGAWAVAVEAEASARRAIAKAEA